VFNKFLQLKNFVKLKLLSGNLHKKGKDRTRVLNGSKGTAVENMTV
jgi:hypothetical protein